MSILQNPRLRSFFRRSGAKRLYYKVRFALMPAPEYEERFSSALLEAVHPGDCVWDVGANIGIYSKRFAEKVGTSGSVIAIEPFSATFKQLSVSVAALRQVQCVQCALGAEGKELRVEPVGSLSTGNSLAYRGNSAQSEQICVRTGQELIADGLPAPNILKIDVEGFEEDVLWGFRDFLGTEKKCRAIFVEIHFRVLEQRGYSRAPSRLVSLLRDLGFRTQWLDPSHLAATRRE